MYILNTTRDPYGRYRRLCKIRFLKIFVPRWSKSEIIFKYYFDPNNLTRLQDHLNCIFNGYLLL